MGHSENIEAQTVTETCPTHGQYEAQRKYIELIGKWFTGQCPKCAAERAASEQSEQARKDAEHDLAARRRAGIPPRFQSKTLDTYEAVHDKQQIALAACKKLVAAMQAKQAAPNLILIGKPGTGKSHLCCGMVLELYRTHRVRRVDLPDLIREIRATWSKDSQTAEEYVLEFYGTLDLLIVEEVGTGAGTDDERARIFQVVNRRYEAMLPTVIVSNLDMEALKKEIGERVIDRLREGERSLVVFDWQSHRGAA
jgi:DNA replication protein DnaC